MEIDGARLEVRWIGARAPASPTPPVLVFLHEGLGSAGLWRDFPDRLAAAVGCPALVYSRQGYGASSPVEGPRPLRFMHDEALRVLPALLARLGIGRVFLFGHSDGASIAIVHAATHPDTVCGLVLEAPHVFVEPVCLASIARLAADCATTDLGRRLARHHGANAASTFSSWTEVWLRPEFARWNLEEYLPAISAPVLVVQGEEDEYGTLRQVEAVVTQVGGRAESLVLPGAGHSPHRDRPDEVLEAAARFLRGALACL